MKSIFVILIITIFTSTLFGQVSINTNSQPPDNSAMLDVASINRGFLFPRLSTSGRNSIPSPAKGLLIYNTSSKLFDYFNGSTWFQIGAFPVSSVTGTIRSGGGVSLRTVPGSVPDSSSMLDVNDATRGVLIPRTTINLIPSPAKGLIIYNLSTNYFNYYDGTGWRVLCSTSTGTAGASGSQSPAGIAVNANNALPDPSSILDISATNKGLLIPRLTKNQRDAIKPVSGLTIFNLTSGTIEFYNGSGWYQMKVNLLTSPTPAAHVPAITQITWKWNKIPGQPNYKWNTTNNYATAINLGTDTSKTETGLICNTSYTRYVWAYNDCGASAASALTKATLACSPPNEYCVQATALFARMTVQPTVLRKSAIDRLIRGMIEDTIWSKLDWFHNYAVATEQQALLNWIKVAHNGTNTNMAFHADSGFMGNGTSAYINTNYDPNTNKVNFALQNCSFGYFTWRNMTALNSSISGCTDGVNYLFLSTSYNTARFQFMGLNGGGSSLTANGTSGNGFFYGERTKCDKILGQYNYTRQESPNANNVAGIPVGRNIYIGAFNSNGTASNWDRNTFGLAFGGAALSPSQSNSLVNDINEYLYHIGKHEASMVILGHSTIAARNGNGENVLSVADLMNDSVPYPDGKYIITNLAMGGDSIRGQKTKWQALPESTRRTADFVFMEVGGNDIIAYDRYAKDIIALYNDLIATIVADIGPTNKIVVSPMQPIRNWYECVAPGGTCTYRWPLAKADENYLRWDSINKSVMGTQAPLVVRPDGGVIIRTGNYTATMTLGAGYRKPIYELPIPDGAHSNGIAKQMIADEWEQVYLLNK